MFRSILVLAGALAIVPFGMASGVQAATGLAQKGEPDAEKDKFWFEHARPAAAAQLVGGGWHPLTALTLRIVGKRLVVWGEDEFTDDEAPALNKEWLLSARQRDSQPIPKSPARAKADKDFLNLYNEALVNAFQVPLDAFKKSAKANQHVTFAHMYGEPWKYRGKVIPIKGHLQLLRKYDVPVGAENKGFTDIYEGWIRGPTYGAHPLTVIFPVLPDGLQPAEKMNRWVEFYGYLISRYRYKSAEEKERDTLLLIGPTVIPSPAPRPSRQEEVITPAILYGLVGFILAVVVAIVGLNLWFRRGDRRIRAHLDQLQAARTVDMLSNPEPTEGEERPPDGSGPVFDPGTQQDRS